MKKICSRMMDRFQVCGKEGIVRLCGWSNVGENIGNLIDNTVEEVYNSSEAQAAREKLLSGDYSVCRPDECHYLRTSMDDVMIPYKEQKLPRQLCLAFERNCNYACTCCDPDGERRNLGKCDFEENYNIIDKRIREVLPYIQNISANGLGELFCSKHTLQLLSEWKPIADPSECHVEIETNGSLFDEDHWKQIENLGQYHVGVYLTVMSFDEDIYQYLSGCNYPISKIENNLRFIKSLREKGIINYFELATVVQEANFRGIPEFIRRGIDEFGVDAIRLRPLTVYGAKNRDAQWLRDVRVADHPYHEEFLKMLQKPILKHPKVIDYGIEKVSEWTKQSPFKDELKVEEWMARIVIEPDSVTKKIRKLFSDKHLVVYGFEPLGKVFIKALVENGIKLEYIISYQNDTGEFLGTSIIPYKGLGNNGDASRDVCVIITPMHAEKGIRKRLLEWGYSDFYTIKDLMEG